MKESDMVESMNNMPALQEGRGGGEEEARGQNHVSHLVAADWLMVRASYDILL
jgi:hypothetical protein